MDTIDPLGGSYYVESMTAEIKSRVEDKLAVIEKMGGIVAAIESGYISTEISNSAYAFQTALEGGGKVLLGYRRDAENPYRSPNQNSYYVPSADIARQCRERLEALRRTRDDGGVQRALRRLRAAAEAPESPNLVEP
ncbi:MAG: methylmalonyl-CoA mutase, partial [Candidatus Rokubacteria bacterium]|nr:methylmalonyl-CoA mutase [Candidatus Rokubacteria bacterium]